MSDIKPMRPANGGADVAYAHAHRTDFMEFGPGTNGFSGVTTGGRGGQLPPGAAGEGAQIRGRKSGFYAIC